ncbi:MAG: S8 family serine peptidase, partial [Candidatus Subteraquimicrobiales bacterium]|nr:S8 family serine peptidase [Candidatus Subteraquimicrobiales bacterium]
MIHITPDLERELQEKSREEKIHVIVRAVRVERPFVLKALEKSSHTIRQHIRLINAFSMSLPAGEVAELAEEPWVEWVELDKEVKIALDTSVPLIGAPQVWESEFTGKGINVAIIDTGVDRSHLDLSGRIIATKDFTLEGFADLNGHGTMVAGVIAGNGSASEGKYRGVAPEASIIAAKALKSDGTGRMSDVMAAIDWAISIGAHVINLSLGTSGSSDGKDTLSETCDAAVSQGVAVCVAAGNDGPERRTIGS